jgi:hypothetical protein
MIVDLPDLLVAHCQQYAWNAEQHTHKTASAVFHAAAHFWHSTLTADTDK